MDYSEAIYKIDKWMPDDEDTQNEYNDILDNPELTKEEKIEELENFINDNANDRLYNFYEDWEDLDEDVKENGINIHELATQIVENQNNVS